MKSNGLCSTSDDITFDQNWHRYGQVLQEENIIPLTPRSESLGHLSEKFIGKLHSTTLGSVVRTAHLNIAFSETLELEASPVNVLIFITSHNPFNQSSRITHTQK